MPNQFASNLKRLRHNKNITQEKLADDLMIPRPTIGAYEEGRAEPGYDRLIIIAEYFNIEIDRFLKEEI